MKKDRNLNYAKRRSKINLSNSEMIKERLLLRLKTIEMFDKGYVSDFVYDISVKHGWLKPTDEVIEEWKY